jgi:hypothetical protein
VVECGLPKPEMRVRFPSPAPTFIIREFRKASLDGHDNLGFVRIPWCSFLGFRTRLHSSRHSSDLAGDLVNVTPGPVLARLDRTHDRMVRLVEMPGRVSPWRGIATADMAASHAFTQMHPLRSFLQAVLAGVWGLGWRKTLLRQTSQVLAGSGCVLLRSGFAHLYPPFLKAPMQLCRSNGPLESFALEAASANSINPSMYGRTGALQLDPRLTPA